MLRCWCCGDSSVLLRSRQHQHIHHRLMALPGAGNTLPYSRPPCAPPCSPQAGRGHLKQLMSDLEGEQERAAGLAAALDDTRARLAASEGAKEVAEARMARAQKQVAAANEAAAELEAKATALATQLQASWALQRYSIGNTYTAGRCRV